MMMIKHTALVLLLSSTTFAWAGPAEKVANAIPGCTWADKLVPGKVSRLPAQFKVRALQLENGAAQVSVAEGYNFPVFSEGKTEPFANVKIEQSELDKFTADRETIIAHLRWILTTSKGMETTEPLLVDLNGFEGPMITRAAFTGTTLAMVALFNEKEKLVMTLYLENAPPEQRAFQTKEEWNLMRDRFFVALTSCATKALDAQPDAKSAAAAPAVASGAGAAGASGSASTTAGSPMPSTAPDATSQPATPAVPSTPTPTQIATPPSAPAMAPAPKS